MDEYEKMLDQCMCRLPCDCMDAGRFTIPKAEVLIEGARTIFYNFYDIANKLRRDPRHILKFFLKELATSYEERDKKIIFQGKFSSATIDWKIEI